MTSPDLFPPSSLESQPPALESGLLFDVPPDRRPRLEVWKEKHGAATFHSPHMSAEELPWVAIIPADCEEKFREYGVRKEMGVPEIFSMVCRLLDEMKMEGYGETEEAACFALAEAYKLPWLEFLTAEELKPALERQALAR